MNPRERILATTALILIVLGGGVFLWYQFYVVPLNQRAARINVLTTDIETKRERIQQVLAEKAKLNRWLQLSLPPDTGMARRDYEKYLRELLQESGFAPGSFTVTPRPVDTRSNPTLPGPKKEPIYLRQTFTVRGSAELASVVEFLEQFYRTSLLHQIKSVMIQRPLTGVSPQRPNDLVVNLTIEALIVTGAENRPNLLPGIDRKLLAVDILTGLRHGLTGLALVPWAAGPTGPLGPRNLADPRREYAAIAGKNIFFGPPAPERQENVVDVTQFVYLTDITRNGTRVEAFLYDRFNNKPTRLRASPGFNAFRISDSRGETRVRGTVVHLDDRDLIFRADGRYYALHVGESLEQALRKKPLREEEVKALGLAMAPREEK